ncbi:Uma2 family endonuclease [Hymenobacter sp. 5317J-9]|uniref:Uma2 family endonuclease n=1 Tax=Hymenobacter sp. 5317J-9 TaxID=2932250 RepID=UPI001FD7093F|nr:Uma2 family endonuclease [Hymenobacter sp. 5317J-9]UOQ98947.1 Uma2 family endonuclease [Hymenobacter sp. 5317J-9]
MGQSHSHRLYTPDEYFALEQQSEVRHEYFDGEVFAMAGGTKAHNLITQNITLALRAGLRGRGCQVFMEDVRLAVQESFHYTYPDVVVTCDPEDRRDPYLVRQPVLIVEVLSPSTAEYDRSRKFNQYKKIPALRHYILVSQTAWVLEWFRRDDLGQWVHTVFSDPADVLEIPELNLRLPLAEVYDDTDVAPLQLTPEPGLPR